MKKAILILSAVLLSSMVFAVEGENTTKSEESKSTCALKGQITDKLNGEVLTGVAVRIAENNQVVYTNFDGEFVFENLTPGTYTIETSMVSYKDENYAVNANKVDGSLDLQLETIEQ